MLERLAEESGETATFAIPRGRDVVQVSQADGRYLLGATNWVGSEVPPHCSAQGKVFLAFGQLVPAEPHLEARTSATITTTAALQTELADVRRRGWAATWEELEVGLAAVAAPVRGPGRARWSARCRSPARRPESLGNACVPSASWSPSRRLQRQPSSGSLER